ncbi:thioredoxin family protein [Salinirussus salinus]|jgi:thioredoxin-like negative regulator of GroEL|uniref:thioredoxin family protein n=1 Tax=Salinirussus salinus TaxID=1198300 RepID=UPI0013570563|nr:thioredoxin family protein [Salinirussus salinus]
MDTADSEPERPAEPEAEAETERPVDLDDEAELDEFVGANPVALVEFYTEGCGVCASMEPVLGNVARASGAAVGLVNPRDDPVLVDRFDVRSVPTLVLFVDGEPVARRSEGFVGADDLVSWVDSEGDTGEAGA